MIYTHVLNRGGLAVRSPQLARVYLHAWQVTGEPFYRAIVEETLDYVVCEMTSPEGGFYSTQDADSEGEEASSLSGRQTRSGRCWAIRPTPSYPPTR